MGQSSITVCNVQRNTDKVFCIRTTILCDAILRNLDITSYKKLMLAGYQGAVEMMQLLEHSSLNAVTPLKFLYVAFHVFECFVGFPLFSEGVLLGSLCSLVSLPCQQT